MPWYTIQTNPNREAKVIEQIELRKKEHNIEEIREIFSPEEPIVEYKDGKKKERMKRLISNYIFIEMDYSPAVHSALKGIKGVVGFAGNRANPVPSPDSEIAALKARVSGEAPKPKITFDIETKVRITSGSFADFYGIVKTVDYEKNKVKVAINIFNRETLMDLELDMLEIAK